MLCDECGKNEAHIHIVQIGPNGRMEKNLCEECAAGYGTSMFASQQKSMSVDDFLKGVFSSASETDSAAPGRHHELVGKIGCSVCYDTFRQQLEPLLRRVHGSSVHSGKIPHRSGGALEMKHEIEVLRRNLQEAVRQEEYEKAAEYRDRIRVLEKELGKQEGGLSNGSR